MKEIFTLVFIWHFCSLALIVYGAYTPIVPYFKVTEDRTTVNNAILDYAKHKNQKSWLSAAKNKVGGALRKKRDSILNRNRNEIIQICTDAVPADFYGLKVDTTYYEEPQVTKGAEFFLEHTRVNEDKVLKLDMVACPRMTYTDLETKEENYFAYSYKFSKAKSRNSAILFQQDIYSALIYPARLIVDIDFSSLQRRAGSTVHPFVQEFETDSSESVQNTVFVYQSFRHSVEIYEKFQLLYKSFSICRLRRRYIISMCRQILEAEKPGIELDIANYRDHSCRRHPMQIEYTNVSKEASSKFKDRYFVRCPQATRPSNPKDESWPVTFLYLASNIAGTSVVVFYRLNQKGEKLHPLMVVRGLDTRKMKQDKQREKIEPYRRKESGWSEYEKSRSLINKMTKDLINFNSDYFTIKMPATLARLGEQELQLPEQVWTKPLRFIDDRSQVEDFLTEFSQIKTNKLVYQRFQQTHFSIDFCQLSRFEKKYLCDEALNDYEKTRLEPRPAEPSSFDRPCFRQATVLTLQDTDDLPTDKFSVWECPASGNHPELVYFMGKSQFENAVFLYKAANYKRDSDEPLSILYPDTLVYKVNRYRLAKFRVSVGLNERGQQSEITELL